MNKKAISAGIIVVLLAFFFSVNLLSSSVLRSSRVDLTQNKLYTLSQGTRNILASLKEPVRLRFFFSRKVAKDLADVKDYANRTLELLEEFVAHGGDKLKLEVLDPEPFSEEEELAGSFGLRGLPANAAGEMVYFGLAGTNSIDDESRIPFFQPSRAEFLEYDITQLIYKLSDPAKPIVALMSSLQLFGSFDPANPRQPLQEWFIVEQMRQAFEVRNLPPTSTEIENDVDILMIVHPKNLSSETLFAIDQFALRGGRLMVFVDPQCEVEPPPPGNPQQQQFADKSSNLRRLFAAWGVELVPGKLAGDRQSAQRVGWRGQSVDYLPWMAIKDGFNTDDFTTANLKSVTFASAGILRPLDGATTTFEPLVQTSEESMQIDKISVAFGPDPERLLKDFFSEGQPLTLIARINGDVQTAFPDGPPEDPAEAALDDSLGADAEDAGDAEDGEEPEESLAQAWLTQSSSPFNAILVADVDILHQDRWVRLQDFFGMRIARPSANNGDFVINSLDNLSGSNDLISLRSRGSFNRPFDKKDEIRREADSRYRQKFEELEAKLADTRKELADLQGADGSSSLIRSAEQKEKIDEFRAEERRIQKERREVRHKLRKDIESLGKKLKLANIFLIPLLICLVPILMWGIRSNRRRTHS